MPKSLATDSTDFHQLDLPIRELHGERTGQLYPKRKTDHLCYNQPHASQNTSFIQDRNKSQGQGRHALAWEGQKQTRIEEENPSPGCFHELVGSPLR